MALAVPNFLWLEVRESPTEHTGFYDADFFPTQMVQEGPKIRVPDGPGLGLQRLKSETTNRANLRS